LATTKSIAARIATLEADGPSNTSSAKILVPGAVWATIPATLVPCSEASSRALSKEAKSCATTTRHVAAGVPGAVHEPKAGRVKSAPVSMTATAVPAPVLPPATAAGWPIRPRLSTSLAS